MQSDSRPPEIRLRAFYIFLISTVLFGFGQFHRLSGAVTLPPIAADLGMTVESLGFVAAILFFTSAVLQVPNGMLLDRFGPRKVLPVHVGIAILGCLILSYASSYEEVVVARMLLGGGFSVTMMSAYVLFAKWYPVDKFATVASWMMAASSLGSILASYPLAFFIESVGWRPAYWIVAGLTLMALIVGVLIIRDEPPGYKRSDKQPATIRESVSGYVSVLAFPKFFFLLAMGFVAFGPATAIIGMWGGPYLESKFGLGGVARGEILLLMVLAVPVGALFFGWMDRRFESRKTVVLIAVILEIAMFLMLGLIQNLQLWSVCILFTLISFLQQHYIVLAAHCRASFPDYMVGRANSTLNMTSIIGVGFMQSLVGWGLTLFPENGYEISYLVIAAFLVIACLFYLGSREVVPQKPELT